MSIKKTLGGDRLGAGKKMQVDLHNYGRSTHDLGTIWRSSMAAGTLIPFMMKLGLPGDSFDIELNADVKTLPTIGPLFGSYKLQLDVFMCPLRLYNAQLHNNKLGIGMDMSKVKFPLLDVYANDINFNSNIPPEFQQINQSSLLAYLGLRGLGRSNVANEQVNRQVNAIPYIAYWDIYKNYYANKQEEIGAVIHTPTYSTETWIKLEIWDKATDVLIETKTPENIEYSFNFSNIGNYKLYVQKGQAGINGSNINWEGDMQAPITTEEFWQQYGIVTDNPEYDIFIGKVLQDIEGQEIYGLKYFNPIKQDQEISIETFDLNNIDDMREDILKANSASPFMIDETKYAPYGLPLELMLNGNPCSQMPMEGLGLKTYQSDMYNNWLSTEWIDGENGINAVTAVSTAGDSFTLDTLNLSKKVYDMLNRIAVSGGNYDDWITAVYGTEPFSKAETPVYCGGLSKEIVFQEVVSTANAGENDPLGTLAGKGKLSNKHKGGYVTVKCGGEACIILGIVSITPRIDYSQGNDWTVNLKTMNDLHKPALDEIGFQDLITEQMAFWDTKVVGSNSLIQKSAGKQPAWLNYMTDVNRCYGDFADPRKAMFMTLNRRYEFDENGDIEDLTTYINPAKYNYMFAVTQLDAQNFWTQISCDITARRIMSSKIMPNL